MASSKPDILLILLHKLMEEGNMLYKVDNIMNNTINTIINNII